jgi:hypothetical protein
MKKGTAMEGFIREDGTIRPIEHYDDTELRGKIQTNTDNISNLDSRVTELEEHGVEDPEKADKVVGATAGNLATLDENGNLQDSGYKPSDFAPTIHTHTSLVNRIEDIEYILGLKWKLLEESYEFSGTNTANHVHNYNADSSHDGIILPQESYALISVGDSIKMVLKPAGTLIEGTVTYKNSGPYFIITDIANLKYISGTFDIYIKKPSYEPPYEPSSES